jgi:2-C-methyl-D-erythritol 2,4-cyclodiphosphate synthase
MTTRSGIGYDCHRLVEGRRLVLGGVEIESEHGLAGHSDADVLTHAVMDALLGAAGLGDIGEHFPDADPAYRDADSLVLASEVAGRVREAGWRIENVDATVLLEAPRLAPHRDGMRARLAGSLGVDASHVNIKATTSEAMGFIGRGEGAAALAIATIAR